MNAEEKAARRAAALAKLYETKKRIEANSGGQAGPGPANTWSGGSTGVKRSAPGEPARLDALQQSAARAPAGPGSSGNQSVATAGPSDANGTRSGTPGSTPGAARGQEVRGHISKKHRDASQASALLARPYIEYDLSTMQDSKGGYMVSEEVQENQKWLDALPQQTPVYAFDDPRAPSCFECGTKELDFRIYTIFGTRVCAPCRRGNPEKYSLLTKTECKADYLLTEPELRDKELMPHMERPNPYKSTYSNMMLFMRYQVEEFAFKKWGGPEGLDAEYEKREKNKVVRKRAKFESKLRELRNKTRAQTITKTNRERHTHQWGEAQKQDDGTVKRYCECGMSIEELAF